MGRFWGFPLLLLATGLAGQEGAMRITGVVVDASGIPLAGALVQANDGEHDPVRQTSANDGSFTPASAVDVGRIPLEVPEETGVIITASGCTAKPPPSASTISMDAAVKRALPNLPRSLPPNEPSQGIVRLTIVVTASGTVSCVQAHSGPNMRQVLCCSSNA